LEETLRSTRFGVAVQACILATLALPLSGLDGISGQATLPDEALDRLEYAIGEWSVVGERLDSDDSVTEVTEGSQVATWLVPGRIVQMADRDPNGGGRSWWAYDHALGLWTLVSISGENGAVWVLTGTLDEWVITSAPRRLADGRTAMIRFTHYDIEPHMFKALQEVSFDGGVSWAAVYRQTLTRRTIP
jgi:hypothetical protein